MYRSIQMNILYMYIYTILQYIDDGQIEFEAGTYNVRQIDKYIYSQANEMYYVYQTKMCTKSVPYLHQQKC